MTLFEVTFRVKHDCPFGNLSRKFPSMKMFVWCNRKHEVLEMIVGKPSDYEEVKKDVQKRGGIIGEASDRSKVHLITKNCGCTLDNSVSKNIDAYNLLHILPVIYKAGWEYYKVVAFKHNDVKRLLNRLDERGFQVEVLRKNPFEGAIAGSVAITVNSLFANLTKKQIEALLTSYSMGYYQMPRKANASSIATARHVPRTTFEEHLKKAENKLVANLVPYLQLFQQSIGKEIVERENPCV